VILVNPLRSDDHAYSPASQNDAVKQADAASAAAAEESRERERESRQRTTTLRLRARVVINGRRDGVAIRIGRSCSQSSADPPSQPAAEFLSASIQREIQISRRAGGAFGGHRRESW